MAAILGVFESSNGKRLGTFETTKIPSNGQLRIAVSDIEKATKISPGANNFHYSLRVENAFNGFLQHLVVNKQTGIVSDLTTMCRLDTDSLTPAIAPVLATVNSTTQSTTQSFLRFFNAGSKAGTIKLSLASDVSGTSIAEWSSPTILPGASLQISVEAIEKGANVIGNKPTAYTVTVRPSLSNFMQNVLYRPVDGSLTNLSTCDAGVTSSDKQVINVHSAKLDVSFPSTVVVTNTGANPAFVNLGIYDSTSGAKLGSYTTSSISSGGQAILPVATIEDASGINPGPDTYHYNINVEGNFSGFLQHLVTNKQTGVITDMTTVCRLN